MRRSFLLLLALALGVAASVAMLSRAGGPDVRTAGYRPGLPTASPEEDRRSHDLDTHLKDVRVREDEKGRVAVRLVRGEIDLDQAADRFNDLGTTGPGRLEILRRRYPAADDRELAYWLVLWATRGVNEVSYNELAAAQARLFADFHRRFPHSPDPAADPYLRPVSPTRVTGR